MELSSGPDRSPAVDAAPAAPFDGTRSESTSRAEASVITDRQADTAKRSSLVKQPASGNDAQAGGQAKRPQEKADSTPDILPVVPNPVSPKDPTRFWRNPFDRAYAPATSYPRPIGRDAPTPKPDASHRQQADTTSTAVATGAGGGPADAGLLPSFAAQLEGVATKARSGASSAIGALTKLDGRLGVAEGLSATGKSWVDAQFSPLEADAPD